VSCDIVGYIEGKKTEGSYNDRIEDRKRTVVLLATLSSNRETIGSKAFRTGDDVQRENRQKDRDSDDGDNRGDGYLTS
jgi:hypothetical protein